MKPDVILLDIGLPGCSGYDVAQKVRSELPEKPVIVAVTGYGRECDIAKSSLAGIDYHLTKPIEHTLLIAALGERFPKSG
jgi:CheY-like chemotaxis protein